MADKTLTPAQIARGRQKFGSVMGADPVKGKDEEGETKAEDDAFDRFLASPRSQQWLAEQGERATAYTAAADLRRWKARAIKAVKAGKAADVRFESGTIPADEQARIRAALAGAESAGDVAAVFEVKATDDPTDALIDAEFGAALDWAKKAMEG